ncbi:hypothetical protein [Enterobacter hormaechei]|uniref:hypothetical protein n=1 Tax=Enterobacter hormaechei TaxID=158836 RepID=UPI0020B64DCB|nr:hypothetical protein [Enterobacter hormaechei]UTI09425.1 hypothetical protein LZ581_22820 [Enterobacter hormaechei subsp. steigerwaltii]
MDSQTICTCPALWRQAEFLVKREMASNFLKVLLTSTEMLNYCFICFCKSAGAAGQLAAGRRSQLTTISKSEKENPADAGKILQSKRLLIPVSIGNAVTLSRYVLQIKTLDFPDEVDPCDPTEWFFPTAIRLPEITGVDARRA